jgi:hypothetical protein
MNESVLKRKTRECLQRRERERSDPPKASVQKLGSLLVFVPFESAKNRKNNTHLRQLRA